MTSIGVRRTFRGPQWRQLYRTFTKLTSNPHIKAFPDPSKPTNYLLTYLSTDPPKASLAIGTTAALPPTPSSFVENPSFLPILYSVLSQHASQDKDLQAQAQALASPGGANLGSGGAFFLKQQRGGQRRRGDSAKAGGGGGAGGSGAGGASGQGGAGGGGLGGYVHLSDKRNPPDFGRIAWPEDILGSVEVSGKGQIVGEFQPSGTYRIITNEGILGLSDFLTERLVERLKEEEKRQ